MTKFLKNILMYIKGIMFEISIIIAFLLITMIICLLLGGM